MDYNTCRLFMSKMVYDVYIFSMSIKHVGKLALVIVGREA